MVTLAIVSFGLLGVAGIVANSLKSNQSSYTRTQANLLAYDIIERMRANRTTAEQSPSPYNLTLNARPPSGDGVPETDLTQWRKAVAAALPDGKGAVTVNDQTKKVTVVIRWMQRKLDRGTAPNADDTQHITIETRL